MRHLLADDDDTTVDPVNQRLFPRIGPSLARAAWAALVLASSASCSTKDNYLGFDQVPISGPGDEPAPEPSKPSPPSSGKPSPGETDVDAGGGNGEPPADDDGGSIGTDEPSNPGPKPSPQDAAPEPSDAGSPSSMPLTPLQAKVDLPNLLVEVLGVTEEEVDERIVASYDQLFYGDSELEAIYFEVSEDQAYIYDVWHDDTRIDALGYGMLISVLLDHQIEFNKIWSFARTYFQRQEGPLKGYFHEKCDVSGSPCSEESGVYGAFYVATALLMAEGRWGNDRGIFDYGAEARYQLDVMLNKEALNGGIVEGVTNMFDKDTFLPYEQPSEDFYDVCYPGAVITAFWEYWGATTKNSFWTAAANRSRAFLRRVAHSVTGLIPQRAHHDGVPVDGERVFNEISYSFGLHLALDQAWYGVDPAQIVIANDLINFFANYPIQPYPAIFSTSGEPFNDYPSGALIAVNGATAAISTVDARERFIRAVWQRATPSGTYRFFDGTEQILALLFLSGKFRVY